ncbi:REP-associated tyrosine transposase [Stenotrophomonas pigmentata]|uniref:REP-associated tyrosine transposase n=1 Tax=Stenotrophomonas pigmentata TaxID=3055080 RepID=UPI00386F47F2
MLTALGKPQRHPALIALPAINPKPGSKTLRTGRISLPGHAYLVTFTTLARQPLFRELQPASCIAQALYHPLLWRDAWLLAWVLMPDHWHGLVQLGSSTSLSSLTRAIKSNTARSLPESISRPVWAPGFHDRTVRKDQDLKATARYIIMNPVRAGLVSSPRFYPYWNAMWI